MVQNLQCIVYYNMEHDTMCGLDCSFYFYPKFKSNRFVTSTKRHASYLHISVQSVMYVAQNITVSLITHKNELFTSAETKCNKKGGLWA